MRINVYAEELLDDVEWIKKDVDDECRTCHGTGTTLINNLTESCPVPNCIMGRVNHRTFYGIRMYLASPSELHHSPQDDDRSAITFWVPWTRRNGHDFEIMKLIFHDLFRSLEQAANDSERAS